MILSYLPKNKKILSQFPIYLNGSKSTQKKKNESKNYQKLYGAKYLVIETEVKIEIQGKKYSFSP